MSSLPMTQGIVAAIFGSDDDGGERARPSIRRTLSADMSSKKWLAQNGFSSSSCAMKKIASSKDLSLCSIPDSYTSSEDEEEEEGEERESVWAAIQREQRSKKQLDIWSSVTSQSQTGDKSLPPPYVHPLVKRSASSLSAKSLQICTESLGSETGSDGFSSSDTESEKSESEAESERPREERRREVVEEEEYRAVKFSYSTARKSSAPVAARPAFPPPLPSLSSRRGGDGAPTLRMRTRRDNGRLVVEAVPVPASEKNFAAERRDGRLVLNFARSDTEVVPESEEQLEELFPSETETEIEEEEQHEANIQEEQSLIKKEPEGTESRLINFHRLALMANKPIALPNRRNPEFTEEKEEKIHEKPSHMPLVSKSLPPRPRGPVGRLIPSPAEAKVSTTAAASLNNYDYFWRTKINDSNDNKPLSFKNPTTENDRKEFDVSRGNGYLVPFLKGCCKVPGRSVIREPRCIATS